jgi:hypothetical protein
MMPRPMDWRWTVTAHGYAVLVALGLGYFIAGSPLQVSESLRNMLAVQRSGLWELIVAQFSASGFLRPLLFAQIDVAFELANGRYFEMFKAIHVVQVVLTAVLFVHLLRVRTAVGALAVPFGVAMLFGAHTFAGTVLEGFPINTFLTIVVCCLMAATLVQGTPALWRDVAAVLLFVCAALTVESGLLVWVCLAAAWLAGFRGVSARAVLATTALLGVYLFVRFGPLSVGAPDLLERSSGYGFRVLDPPELIARFGDNPFWFYAYNVASQVLTVLFAEPKSGVWVFTRELTTGELMPREIIALASSTGATILIAWYAVSRVTDWRRRTFTTTDRWLFVSLAMLVANAVISYPYTKNVIVSPAGVFHALAATLAFGSLLERMGRAQTIRLGAVATSLALALLSAAWAVRLVGIHYSLREKAFIARNDWTEVVIGQPPADVDIERYPAAGKLIEQLRDEAVARRVANPAFGSPYGWRYFEQNW